MATLDLFFALTCLVYKLNPLASCWEIVSGKRRMFFVLFLPFQKVRRQKMRKYVTDVQTNNQVFFPYI